MKLQTDNYLDDYNIGKIQYFTLGLPSWLSRLAPNVNQSARELRRIHHSRDALRRRRFLVLNLRKPMRTLIEWGSLLRRFDLECLIGLLNPEFLDEIGENDITYPGIDDVLEVASWGFQLGDSNVLICPNSDRKIQHHLQKQMHGTRIDRFYQNAHEWCDTYQNKNETLYFDGLYYEFMYSPEAAFERWRSELEIVKNSNLVPKWRHLVKVAEDAQFVLEDAMAAEVFWEMGEYEERDGQQSAATEFFQYSIEIFDYGQAQNRKAILAFKEKQNRKERLEWIAASRQLLDEEKRLLSVWTSVTIIVALLGGGAISVTEAVIPYIALASFMVIIAELVVLKFIRKKRELAARIQELFDCEVLELDWNKAIANDEPGSKEIQASLRRFLRKAKPEGLGKFKNWFSLERVNYPNHQTRVACQRYKIESDKESRNVYAWKILGATILFFILMTAFGLVANWSMMKFYISLFPLGLPFLALGLKHAYDSARAACDLGELHIMAQCLEESAFASEADSDDLVRRTRELQDRIFLYRKDNSPIFNWLDDISILKHR